MSWPLLNSLRSLRILPRVSLAPFQSTPRCTLRFAYHPFETHNHYSTTYVSPLHHCHQMGEDITRPPKRRKLDEKESSCEDGPSDPQKKGQSGQVSNGADVTVQGDTGISEGTSKGAERGKKKDKTMSRSEYRRQGKGRRRGTRNQDDQTEAAQSNEPKAPRLPKRQCALLIGFCGAGYNGMQM